MMKPLILILFFIHSNLIFGQFDSQDIYSEVYEEYILKITPHKSPLIILEKALYRNVLNQNDFAEFKKEYKNLERGTFLNFLSNQNQVLDDDFKIKNAEIILLKNKTTIPADELYLKYPEWNRYYYEFSNIAYNNTKTQAFLYYGFFGENVGGGIYIIFEKIRGKWKKVKQIPSWAK